VESIGRKIEKLIGKQETEDTHRKAVLADKLAALEKDIATATRRLLTIADDEIEPFRRAFEAMKRERKDLADELDRTEESRQVSVEEARRMREALADLGRLEEVIADKPPELVRDLLSRIVEKVTLHFAAPGKPDAIGRRKRPLSHMDVTFRPEVAHLFRTGCSSAWSATRT
jgi:hypothetical protein